VTAYLSQHPETSPDLLTSLGFEHGEPDEPLLRWPRPQRWTAPRPRTRGRHRVRTRSRTA